MFTGLVEGTARLAAVSRHTGGATFTLEAPFLMDDLRVGDSVAVNGVCLTAETVGGGSFTATAVPETLRRTNLGELQPGGRVHVERAMRADGRFGGHIVSGHIDGIGHVADVYPDGEARVLVIRVDPSLARYMVDKGSVAVDGVSLTIMRAERDRFSVSIIPHTQAVTRFGEIQIGDTVNIECDVIAKYVERLLAYRSDAGASGGIDAAFLARHGFLR
ncbi:riboflavin synthase [Alicyclobacillus sendaiensis]|uniref:Riboflavin synthase n=1 Tax=Alicyclobacillus sendaiensis PA2 TaxID=3029425 RepID=A0ABT6XUS5_ALISE|nr:riboflavin synthase [Alicyclobacillus sendaiensis]MDI9258572.1 riboflavin synthase [Alicyclobacillus sendaiensis PA2]